VHLTARRLNRATLHRQLLLRRAPLSVVEGLDRAVALQAQEPASPYVALWNRLHDFDPAELDRAFADQSIVKATLMRVTLHAVGGTDYPAFHEAMQPTLRAARLHDRRFGTAGLSIAEADALVPEVLAFTATPRTNAEVEAWLDTRLGAPPSRAFVWWALRQSGPFVHAPSDGPWSFTTRPRYVAARERRRSGDPALSMQGLAFRYLQGFGPASAADLSQFALVSRPRARAALDALGERLVRYEGPDGAALVDVRDGHIPDEDTPAPPRLLAMWDSILLAHVDRSRFIPPDYRAHVIRRNGDVLPTLLVDGLVAGVWRPLDEGIEATAFHPLPDDVWGALEAEAGDLIAFLARRDPGTYRRYARWWTTLPSAQVRILGRGSVR
jgi:hypothetical protein